MFCSIKWMVVDCFNFLFQSTSFNIHGAVQPPHEGKKKISDSEDSPLSSISAEGCHCSAADCKHDSSKNSTCDEIVVDNTEQAKCTTAVEKVINSLSVDADKEEESDEDNENVIVEDIYHPNTFCDGDKELYHERGPCKVSRSNYSSRYNPMVSSTFIQLNYCFLLTLICMPYIYT